MCCQVLFSVFSVSIWMEIGLGGARMCGFFKNVAKKNL